MRNIFIGLAIVMICIFVLEPSIFSLAFMIGGMAIFTHSALKLIRKLEKYEEDKK